MTLSPVNKLVLQTSLPVMFGYIPLGAAFGVLFSGLDYHWLWATAMALFIYAGAAQFLAVGLLAGHAGLTEIALATLLLNSRHLFYGLALTGQQDHRGWRRLYQIFSLTDETFSLLVSTPLPATVERGTFRLRLSALHQLYWVIGCTAGAWAGSRLSFNTDGIAFVLPALFMVLAIEQYRHLRDWRPFAAALVIGLATLCFISRDHMLLIAILLSLSLLLLQYAVRRPAAVQSGENP